MISKQRLKELIEQGATIYRIRDNMIDDYQLCSCNYLKDNDLIYENVLNNYWKSWIGKLDDLFETKEDAEFYLEFGCIPREEELRLPSFEKFKENKYGISFRGKEPECYYTFYYDEKLDNIVLYDNDCEEYTDVKKATKENYFEACKLCRKLWLGEEV